jgi:ribosomal protein RSM22 (predicted rRNA methylase)
MDLCTPEGRLLRNTVSKSNMHHIPSLYTALRKTTWGGLFPVLAGKSAFPCRECFCFCIRPR